MEEIILSVYDLIASIVILKSWHRSDPITRDKSSDKGGQQGQENYTYLYKEATKKLEIN